MGHSSKTTGSQALSGLFEFCLRKGYTIQQVKWAIREEYGHMATGTLPRLYELGTHIDHRDIVTVLRSRFSPMTGDARDFYNNAQRRLFIIILNMLGEWSTDVADTLQAQGVLGFKSAACDCPVSRWLTVNADAWTVLVSPNEIVVDGFSIETPTTIERFVSDFDSDRYPALCALPVELRV